MINLWSTLAVALLLAITASANPIPSSKPSPNIVFPYLYSENLTVTISETNAIYEGIFSFAEDERFPEKFNPDRETKMSIDLPIWYPENVAGRWTVNEFSIPDPKIPGWIGLGNSRVIRDALAVKIQAPQTRLTNEFVAYYLGGQGQLERPDEPGFNRLSVEFDLPAEVAWKHAPVIISYCHPLVSTNGVGLFYYMPYLPDTTSPSVRKRYSITIKAKDCSLTVTTGEQMIWVENGGQVVIRPIGGQPIRTVSKPRLSGY